MKAGFSKYLFLFLIVITVIITCSIYVLDFKNNSSHLGDIEFQYYEDPTGKMGIEKV